MGANLGEVRKIVVLNLCRGIQRRIDSGRIERRFVQQYGNQPQEDRSRGPLGLSFQEETRFALSELRNNIGRCLQGTAGQGDEKWMQDFDSIYQSLLPPGGMVGQVDKAGKEMAKGMIDYAMALQELVRKKVEVQTAIIDVYMFGVLLMGCFVEAAHSFGGKGIQPEKMIERMKTEFTSKLLQNKLFIREDAEKVPALLEECCINEDNLFDWIGKWWERFSVFQATPEERASLGMNMLSEVFYGEGDE